MHDISWQDSVYGHHTGPLILEKAGCSLIACKTCGFRHVVPLPNAEQLKSFYEESFYQAEKDRYLSEAEEDFAWKAAECSLRYDMAADIIGKKTGRVLDIGSGPGDFLKVGADLGWQVEGIEPSPVASRYASERGLDVTCGFFNAEQAATLGQYDFIHLSEVLEHVAEPTELLKLARGLLAPGGVLCVSVPNDFNPLQKAVVKAFDKKEWWVVPDHHLNYFDFDSLTGLLSACGYDIRKKLTNFPMELFLLMGQDYTADPALGRRMHGWRKQMDIHLKAADKKLMKTFYESLAETGMGRLAIVFATAGAGERV